MATMAAMANNTSSLSMPLLFNKQAPRTGAFSVLLVTFISSLGTSHALALDWKLTPTLNGTARLTDNVNQSATDPESALILSVTPGFSLVSKGSRRVQARLQYGLTGVARYGGDNSTDLNHNLGAIGKAELMEDFLFIDGSARISQELISLLGSQADAETNSSNRATVGSYSLSPYIQKRLGTFAQATVRYTLSGALFQNNAGNDVTSNRLNASLTSGTRFNDFSWGLNYSLRDATIQGGQDAQFEHYGANFGYALTRHFRVIGTVGYDKNDYASSAGDISGDSWSAGIGWSPTRRTSLEASFGEAYFGRTYSFNFSHRTHYSVWTARYQEGTSDISQLLRNTQPFTAWICDGDNPLFPSFGVGAFPPEGKSNCTELGTAPAGSVPIGIANGIFISKTLRGGAAWSKGKSNLGLNVFSTRRQYQQLIGQPEDQTRGISATYGYRLRPHTTMNTSLGYNNIQVPVGLGTITARDDDLYTISVGLHHRFDPKLSGVLTLRHQQRDSNDNASNYDENSVTASVSKRF